jgi:DNA-binding helix-hairpin-helix protein with protein kinase domain
MPKIAGQRLLGQFCQRACQFYARGAAADDDKSHQALSFDLVQRCLGIFERQKRLFADIQSVLERLQRRRVRAPCVVSEIAVLRSGRDDQVVERMVGAMAQNSAGLRIDTDHRIHQDRRIVLVAKQAADRHSDVGRGHARGGNLVKQRLKQMVVLTVDDGDVDRRVGQAFGRCKTAETRADDDDFRLSIAVCLVGMCGHGTGLEVNPLMKNGRSNQSAKGRLLRGCHDRFGPF